jgi:hypothetical protein
MAHNHCDNGKRHGVLSHLKWYILLWLCFTFCCELLFLPTIIEYNYYGFVGDPRFSYPGFGGDAYVGAIMGAIMAPIAMCLVTIAVWLFLLFLNLLFRK